MSDFKHEVNNWIIGVTTSVDGDQSPGLTLAKNTQLHRLGVGRSVIGSRGGLRVTTRFKYATAYDPPTTGMAHMQTYSYATTPTTTYTNYLACLARDGRMFYKPPSDTWSEETIFPSFPVGTTTWFSDTHHIDSTVMNNRLFMVNGGENPRSLKEKTEVAFGLSAPPVIFAGGVANTFVDGQPSVLPADTYDVYMTNISSATGGESNPSPIATATTTTGQVLLISPNMGAATPFSTEELTLYGSVRFFLRRRSTQGRAYVATRVMNINGATLNAPDGTISMSAVITAGVMYINSSAQEIADHILPMPSLTENSKPPSGLLHIATYGRRLIAANRRQFFWSKLDQPDSFPPNNVETVNTGEGDEITGLFPISDEILVVFTKSSIFGLFGNDPQYWTLRPINTTVGCASHKSIIEFEGQIAWWSPQYGPVIMKGMEIENIGLEQLGRSHWSYGPELDDRIKGGWDPANEHILWVLVSQLDPTMSTNILPYNYRARAWVASEWSTIPISAMATGYGNNGQQRLFVADRICNLYYFDTNIGTDGRYATTDVWNGNFVASSSEITTFTLLSGSVYGETVGSTPVQLDTKDRTVTILDSSGVFVAQRYVVSNSGTVVTLDRAVNLTSGATYTFVIGAALVEIGTPWFDGGDSFARKRFDKCFVQVTSAQPQPTHTTIIDYQKNMDTSVSTRVGEITVTTDEVVTDPATNAVMDQTSAYRRYNVFKNAQCMRLILRSVRVAPVVYSKLGLTGKVLSDRLLR